MKLGAWSFVWRRGDNTLKASNGRLVVRPWFCIGRKRWALLIVREERQG